MRCPEANKCDRQDRGNKNRPLFSERPIGEVLRGGGKNHVCREPGSQQRITSTAELNWPAVAGLQLCSSSGECQRGGWLRDHRESCCLQPACPYPNRSNRSCAPECCTSNRDTG